MPSELFKDEPAAIRDAAFAVVTRMGGLCPDPKCPHCPGLVKAITNIIEAVRLDVLGFDRKDHAA